VTTASPSDRICADCDGTLGVGKYSPIWQMFSEATFTGSYIGLGCMHTYITYWRSCDAYLTHCQSDGSSMCTFETFINGEYAKSRLSGHSMTTVPQDVYKNYISGKNLHNDYEDRWDPITIIPTNRGILKETAYEFLLSKGIDAKKCYKNMGLNIKGSHIVTKSNQPSLTTSTVHTQREVQLSPSSDNNAVIGINTMKNYIFYYSHRHDIVMVISHSLVDHYSWENMVLFCILFTLFVRWKLIRTGKFLAKKQEDPRGKWVLAINQIVAMIVVVVLYVLPGTRNAMSDFPNFDLSVGTILVLCMCGLSYSIILTHWVIIKGESYTIRSMSSVAYETILLYGIWLALIERRVDGLESIPTTLANILVLYSTIYHLVSNFLHAYIAGFDHMSPSFYLWYLMILPSLSAYQLYITYVIFALPAIQLLLPSYNSDIQALLLWLLFMVVFSFSLYITTLSVNKVLYTWKKKLM
jgi:hypothetical protein